MFSYGRTLCAVPDSPHIPERVSIPASHQPLCANRNRPGFCGRDRLRRYRKRWLRALPRCCVLAPCVRSRIRLSAASAHRSYAICNFTLVAALIVEYVCLTASRWNRWFTALNIKTALRLAEVRGVVLLAAAQAGIPSFSYSPREVKASVAGYGHAGKEQVQQMVRALLGLSETPEPADAADALAVALCHVQMAESKAGAAKPAKVAPRQLLAVRAGGRNRAPARIPSR